MRKNIVIILLAILAFTFCKDKNVKKKNMFYYVVDSERKMQYDTINTQGIIQIDTADLNIGHHSFIYKNIQHGIAVYTSDNHATIDGGHLYYTLDTLGVIYQRSTTWFSCMRLNSNNDSINDLISQAFSHILSRPELHCYQCRHYDKFYEPVMESENNN